MFIVVLVNAIPNATDNPIGLVGPRGDRTDGCQPTEGRSMRLDYRAVLPEASRAMSGLEKVVESSTLEPKLLELVKQRASQINGCAYCLDMHTKDARAIGEDEQRLHLVAVWREAPFFAPRERAALAWTEALTLLPQTGAPDDVYLAMAREFDPAEQVALTLAIVAINGWNRLAVGFRRPVGSYVSSRHPEPATMP
jgi:AhpD family alkylhydroperoxidase